MAPTTATPRHLVANLSPSARLEFVIDLLHPRAIEACPTCGHGRVVDGAPLITREDAAAMIHDANPLQRERDEAIDLLREARRDDVIASLDRVDGLPPITRMGAI